MPESTKSLLTNGNGYFIICISQKESMETATKDLIKVIDKERTKRNLSHRQFSLMLGIDPALWHRIRAGERPVSLNTLQIFMHKLPELAPAVTDFVVSQGNNNQKEE